jgi:WD40 repeat protein
MVPTYFRPTAQDAMALASLLFVFYTCFITQVNAESISFKQQVAPVLLQHCIACHGPKRAEGGYRLDTIEQLLKPGDSGETPVVDTAPLQSEIYIRMISHDENVRMPADSEALEKSTTEIIRQWIAEGSKFDSESKSEALWSLIPPANYPTPVESYPHGIPVTAMVFSPDGKELYTSGYYEVLVWDIASGKLARRIPNQVQRIYAIEWIQDGTFLAVGGGTPGELGEVRIVNLAGNLVEKVIGRTYDMVLDVVRHPHAPEIAVASADNSIRIIELKSMTVRKTLQSHADWVMQVAFSDDGNRLASASRDKTAKVFAVDSGEMLVSYPGHASGVRGIASCGDGSQWISVGGDNQWHRWNVDGAKKIVSVPLGSEPIRLRRQGEFAWVGCADKKAFLIDLKKNAIHQKLESLEDVVSSVAVDVSSQKVATGCHNGKISIWNASDGSLVMSWMAKP